MGESRWRSSRKPHVDPRLPLRRLGGTGSVCERPGAARAGRVEQGGGVLPLQPGAAGTADRRLGRGARGVPAGAEARPELLDDSRRGRAAPARDGEARRGDRRGAGRRGARQGGRRRAPRAGPAAPGAGGRPRGGGGAARAPRPSTRRSSACGRPTASRCSAWRRSTASCRTTPAAARAWEKYLDVDPGNFEAHVQHGTHLLLAGESERAAAALKTRARAAARLGARLPDARRHLRAGRADGPGGAALPQGAGDRARERADPPRARRDPAAVEAPGGGARRGRGRDQGRRQQPLRAST